MDVVLSRSSSDLLGHDLTCRSAESAAEAAVHAVIRHAVFVQEQGLFDGTDRDGFDTDPTVQHVVGYVGDVPAGTVRLYRLPSDDRGERLWKGDRLAVLPGYRHAGLGGPLVRYAVTTAGAAGGDRMIAYVQLTNVAFFGHLGWSLVGEPFTYVGEPHQQMSIDLR
jgi:putative N-acetyltransferase (TIGR04045 family)